MPRKQTIWKKNHPHNQHKAVLENVKREFRQKSNAELYEWMESRGVAKEDIPEHRKDRLRAIVASFDYQMMKIAQEELERREKEKAGEGDNKDGEHDKE